MAISSGEGSDNINVVEKAKIYKNPKTEYEEAVNDAAVHIALQDAAILSDRGSAVKLVLSLCRGLLYLLQLNSKNAQVVARC